MTYTQDTPKQLSTSLTAMKINLKKVKTTLAGNSFPIIVPVATRIVGNNFLVLVAFTRSKHSSNRNEDEKTPAAQSVLAFST